MSWSRSVLIHTIATEEMRLVAAMTRHSVVYSVVQPSSSSQLPALQPLPTLGNSGQAGHWQHGTYTGNYNNKHSQLTMSDQRGGGSV